MDETPKLTELSGSDLDRAVRFFPISEALVRRGYRVFVGERFREKSEKCNYFLLPPGADPNIGPFEIDYIRFVDILENSLYGDTSSGYSEDLLAKFYGRVINRTQKLLPFLDEIISVYNQKMNHTSSSLGLPNDEFIKDVKYLKFLAEKVQYTEINDNLSQQPTSKVPFSSIYNEMIAYTKILGSTYSTKVAEMNSLLKKSHNAS